MGPIFYFSEEGNGKVRGSSFGEPDGTEHAVELLEGNGQMILRVRIEGQPPVDLLLADNQAVAFAEAADAILRRIGRSRT